MPVPRATPRAKPIRSSIADVELRNKYEDLIHYGNAHPGYAKENIYKLRKLILLEGLPKESEEEERARKSGSPCSLRGTVWKILMNVKHVNAERYINLVQQGPSVKCYQQIRKDIGRTFMNDQDFAVSVPQDRLSRCLNAFANSCADSPSTNSLGYIQGMNAICGAFLYVLPEVDAFYCFSALVVEQCYQYLVPSISGVYEGLNLLTKALEYIDPELHTYLIAKGYKEPLLMHAVLSLNTGTPPLEEVLHLWDFLFAFGVHMNIVLTLAQLVLMRDTLLAHSSPCSLFRSLPPLDSQLIISLSVQLVRQFPPDLYDKIVAHPMGNNNVVNKQL
jgi:cell cycle arrest protein BUB2